MNQRLHERWAERRRDIQRIVDEAAERLIEVLSEYGEPAVMSDKLREQAAYVMGLEGDGLEDEDE